MVRIWVRDRTRPSPQRTASACAQNGRHNPRNRLKSSPFPLLHLAIYSHRATYHFEELTELFKLICSTHQSIEWIRRIWQLKFLGFSPDSVQMGSPFGQFLVSNWRALRARRFDISYDLVRVQKRPNRWVEIQSINFFKNTKMNMKKMKENCAWGKEWGSVLCFLRSSRSRRSVTLMWVCKLNKKRTRVKV